MTLLSRRSFLETLFGSAAAMAGMGAYAFGFEPAYRLRIQAYAPRLPRWPDECRLSIAVIADPHAGEPHMPLRRMKRSSRRPTHSGPTSSCSSAITRPDTASSPARSRCATSPPSSGSSRRPWAPTPFSATTIGGTIRPPRGSAKGRSSPRELEAVGIPVLENDAVRLEKDGHAFWILGLGDQLALLGRPLRGVHDLQGTLAKLVDDAPAILLAHEPDIFPDVPERVALTLSGHTHGGQVRLLGYSPIVPSRHGNRYAYGHVVENGRHLIVSGGLGTSIMPVRFGIPPEIVHLKLGGAPAA